VNAKDKTGTQEAVLETPLGVDTRVVIIEGDCSFITERSPSVAIMSLQGKLGDSAETLNCRMPRGRRFRPIVNRLIKRYNLVLDKEEVREVIWESPPDLATVVSAFKMAALSKFKPMLVLRYVFNNFPERSVFRLVKMLLAKKTSDALRMLQDLIDSGVEGALILSMITRYFRLLALLSAGIDISDLVRGYETASLEALRGSRCLEDIVILTEKLVEVELSVKRGDSFGVFSAVFLACRA